MLCVLQQLISVTVRIGLGTMMIVMAARSASAGSAPVMSDAQWVWDAGAPHPMNCFLMFRKDFVLPGAPDAAVLHLTVSDRYLLYVNGECVGRGPARSGPRFKSYDTHQIAGRLRTGKNVVAVLAYHYGLNDPDPDLYQGNYYAAGDRAGLWAKAEIQVGGKSVILPSGPDWRVAPALGWKQDVKPILTSAGFPEWYDARRDPVNWMGPDFDDSSWSPATLIPPNQQPWKSLAPRDVPMMRQREVLPTRIVKTGEVLQSAGEDVYARFTAEAHLPLTVAEFNKAESLLVQGGPACRARAKTGPDKKVHEPFVVLDFGRQVFGFPIVRIDAAAGAVVEIVMSPYFENQRIATSLMRVGSRYIARDGKQTWQPFEYAQFRYLQIAVRGSQPVRIESVGVVLYEYPVEQRGRFECSDSVLTKVWQACVNTVYLQMEDVLAIDAWRERVNWVSCDHLEAIIAAYGDTEVVRRHFRMIAREPLADGRLPISFPPSRSPKSWIPCHLLIWLHQVDFYYQYAGDRDFLAELYPAVKRQMDWYHGLADKNGLIQMDNYWNWCDWAEPPHPNVDNRGAGFVGNAMYLAALEACVDMAHAMDDPASAQRWTERAAAVRNGLHKYWNEKRGLFEDAFSQDKFTGQFSELANGLALQHGVANPKQSARIISQFRVETPMNMAKPTPIWIGQILWPMAQAGAGGLEKVIELIRGRYEPIVKNGETIPELWTPSSANARSPIHGGNTPALILSREVLGIKGIGPGFKECRIEVPDLKGIDWAKGVFPSVRGDIAVEWRRSGEQWSVEVKLPEKLKTTIVLPAACENRPITMDGASVSAKGLVVTGGKHRVEVRAKAQ